MLVIPIFSLELNQFDGFKAERRESKGEREGETERIESGGYFDKDALFHSFPFKK